jgi:hypothetical protein
VSHLQKQNTGTKNMRLSYYMVGDIMRGGWFWAWFFKLRLYFISLRFVLTIIFCWQCIVTLLCFCGMNIILLFLVGLLLLLNLFLCY